MRAMVTILLALVLCACAPVQAIEDEIVEVEQSWVTVGKTQWRLTGAHEIGVTLSGENERYDMDDITTSGKFVSVTLEFENLGLSPVELYPPELSDARGRSYAAHGQSYYYVPDKAGCGRGELLNPNLQSTCIIIYEVAADAEGLSVDAHDLNSRDDNREAIPLGF